MLDPVLLVSLLLSPLWAIDLPKDLSALGSLGARQAGSLNAASVPAVPEPVLISPLDAKTPRPFRILMMGPPGSGKGTQAKKLAADFGMAHVSSGEMLVEYARTHPEVNDYIRRGALVPIEIVVPMVRDRLSQPDARDHGFILDGFPRGTEQAAALLRIAAELGVTLDAVVRLEVPEEELLRRILARGRPDDTEPVFRNRMRVYREQTEPVYRYLRGQVPILSPSAEGDAEMVYQNVRRALATLRRG